jgi:xylose isomerase
MWQDKPHRPQPAHRSLVGLYFGSEASRIFFLVRLAKGKHFDAHAYRTEDTQGVWDFARGCIRNYLALAAKAREFDQDPRVAEAMAYSGVAELAEPTVGPYSADTADRLKAETFDVETLALRGFGNEALDQLVIDHILGTA